MDSIIFDLDGTLWDSLDTVLHAWNGVLKKDNQSKLTRQDFEKITGLPMNEMSKKLFPNLSSENQQRIVKQCYDEEKVYLEKQGGLLYSNVEDVLNTLSQKYKLYIVSNCQDGYIEAFYKYHKLGKYFLDYESYGRTGLSKGENINLVIERNNLLNPVYVGDTEGDLKAARFAGIPFIYASYGFGEVSESDKVINHFEDLLNIF